MSIKNTLYLGLYTVALLTLVPAAQAAETTVKNDTTTGVTTDVGTVQNSGVTLGDKTHIKGDVYTGSNTSATDVDTSVSTRTSTDAAAADDDIESSTTSVGTVKGKGSVTTGSNGDIRSESESSREAHWDSGKRKGHSKQDNWENRER